MIRGAALAASAPTAFGGPAYMSPNVSLFNKLFWGATENTICHEQWPTKKTALQAQFNVMELESIICRSQIIT